MTKTTTRRTISACDPRDPEVVRRRVQRRRRQQRSGGPRILSDRELSNQIGNPREAYELRHSEILQKLERIKQTVRRSDLHDREVEKGGGVTWGDVGDLGRIAELLQEASDVIHKEGEYANP